MLLFTYWRLYIFTTLQFYIIHKNLIRNLHLGFQSFRNRAVFFKRKLGCFLCFCSIYFTINEKFNQNWFKWFCFINRHSFSFYFSRKICNVLSLFFWGWKPYQSRCILQQPLKHFPLAKHPLHYVVMYCLKELNCRHYWYIQINNHHWDGLKWFSFFYFLWKPKLVIFC